MQQNKESADTNKRVRASMIQAWRGAGRSQLCGQQADTWQA